jgi:UV DNA damage repair endonuclease
VLFIRESLAQLLVAETQPGGLPMVYDWHHRAMWAQLVQDLVELGQRIVGKINIRQQR